MMNLRLKISKPPEECGKFLVEPVPQPPGTYPVGRGDSIIEAIGSYFHNNQTYLGISFDVDATAWPAEVRRRARELAKR